MGSLYRSQHELVFVFKHGRDPHRNHIQLGRFWIRRARRLLPAVGVLIAVAMIVLTLP